MYLGSIVWDLPMGIHCRFFWNWSSDLMCLLEDLGSKHTIFAGHVGSFFVGVNISIKSNEHHF